MKDTEDLKKIIQKMTKYPSPYWKAPPCDCPGCKTFCP